jgi:predicted small lipoprotein YifL
MHRSNVMRIIARVAIVAMLAAWLTAGIAGCGQRGPLYYPDKDNPDKRR